MVVLLCGRPEALQIGGKDAKLAERQAVHALAAAAHVRFKAAAAARKQFCRLQHFIDCNSGMYSH